MEYLEARHRFIEFRETLEGEHLKTMAEFSLHALAKYQLGLRAIELASGGDRIIDERLTTSIAGVELENPLMVGAGWDKKGWAVDGLYQLGFAGAEVGTVPVHPQSGNKQPRLHIDGLTKSVGLNSFGFNAKGEEAVAGYLEGQHRYGVVGISVGKNKLTPDKYAPWAHAAVADRLHEYADYFVINLTSPNTEGLINLIGTQLPEIVSETRKAIDAKGRKPLLIKTSVDLSLKLLDAVIQTCIDEHADGIIDTNTTTDSWIKSRYGWAGKPGGVSGNDPEYRERATERMRYITRATRGTGLARVGVGGINDTATGLERLKAGAQALQVVTGIRHRKARIARDINLGLIERMERDGVRSITEYIGVAA